MLSGKPVYDFLFAIIELFSLALTADALKGKTCQDSLLSGGGRSVRAKISGERGRPWGIFFGFYKTTHFAIWQCKLHRAMCHRFNTMPACDRRTDRQTELPYLVQRLQCIVARCKNLWRQVLRHLREMQPIAWRTSVALQHTSWQVCDTLFH